MFSGCRNNVIFRESVQIPAKAKVWTCFKGRVHCFSMQVVMNKCFLQNPEKNFGADPYCRFREKSTFNFEK